MALRPDPWQPESCCACTSWERRQRSQGPPMSAQGPPSPLLKPAAPVSREPWQHAFPGPVPSVSTVTFESVLLTPKATPWCVTSSSFCGIPVTVSRPVTHFTPSALQEFNLLEHSPSCPAKLCLSLAFKVLSNVSPVTFPTLFPIRPRPFAPVQVSSLIPHFPCSLLPPCYCTPWIILPFP